MCGGLTETDVSSTWDTGESTNANTVPRKEVREPPNILDWGCCERQGTRPAAQPVLRHTWGSEGSLHSMLLALLDFATSIYCNITPMCLHCNNVLIFFRRSTFFRKVFWKDLPFQTSDTCWQRELLIALMAACKVICFACRYLFQCQ